MDSPQIDVRTACIAAHEYYTSLREAGFTRLEALYLVATILTGGPKAPEDRDGN